VVCGGSGSATCVDNTLTGAAFCDGLGDCQAGDVACQGSSFCDASSLACCTGLFQSGALGVDNGTGNDGACCGFGGQPPCRTITRAMQLVDAAHAQGVTITATIDGGSGDWGNGEIYPILLGWSVELSAAGIVFGVPNDKAETFDITHYSTNDASGVASIVGEAGNAVMIGIVPRAAETSNAVAIQVEAGGTLYLANASVGSAQMYETTAIMVIGGGTLVLAQDQSGAITGPVNIGGDSHGWNGIVCVNSHGEGCTITDAILDAGSSLTVQGQQNLDIYAEDGATITLNSAPVVGIWPEAPTFGECNLKADTGSSDGPAILLVGSASLQLRNALVQCIQGTGIELRASSTGAPSLDLRDSMIRNTTTGIHAEAGQVSVEDSTIMFNEIGVWQDSSGTVDLSGFNTVSCNYGLEVGQSGGGVSVLNTSSNPLDATDVAWDTVGPDLFKCNAQLQQCACQIASCSEPGGSSENMDAAYTSQPILTTGNRGLDTPCIAN